MSLGEFAVQFETITRIDMSEDNQDADAYAVDDENAVTRQRIITLLDNAGRMKARTRPAILRTRYYTASSDPEAYYYSLLVTHVPFRAEEELLEGFSTAKEAFMNKRHLLRPLQHGYNAETMSRWETKIQQAISRLVAENAATNMIEHDEDNDTLIPLRMDNDDCILLNQGEQEEEIGENETDTRFSDEEFERALSSLNIQQRQLFRRVSQKLLNEDNQPLRMFVTGGAGT